MYSRLIPDHIVLRLAPEKGGLLRSACLSASSLPAVQPSERASLLSAAKTGLFGVSELSLLQRLLDGAGRVGAPSVREMVLAAEEDGLSSEALAALRASRAASANATAARRLALEARAAEREYQALLRRDGAGADEGASSLRAVAPQVSLGGGLFLVLLSATLMGYYLGIQLYGRGSTGVRRGREAGRVSTPGLICALSPRALSFCSCCPCLTGVGVRGGVRRRHAAG